jgi:hypothetical protein
MKARALFCCTALLFVAYILAPPIHAQEKNFCNSNNYSSGDNESVRDLREFTVSASGSINVDSGRNGGVSVKGENRSDVLVRACVSSWARTAEEARSAVSAVRIDQSSNIKAEGPFGDKQNWSVSFEILVPRNTNLDLTAKNGGISIRSVDGNINFDTNNGGVHLADLSGAVKGRTTNGGVSIALTGNTWKGSGLDVMTTNGGVKLTVPSGYAANFETGTTNGGFKSDIAELEVKTVDNDGWTRSKKVRASMNGGGANVRVLTTNGGVKIDSNN